LAKELLDSAVLTESQKGVFVDRLGLLEGAGQLLLRADALGLVESRTKPSADAFTAIDTRITSRFDGGAQIENLGAITITVHGFPLVEHQGALLRARMALVESLTTPTYDSISRIEYAARAGSDVFPTIEHRASIALSTDITAAIETLAATRADAVSAIEKLIVKLADSGALISHDGSSMLISPRGLGTMESLALAIWDAQTAVDALIGASADVSAAIEHSLREIVDSHALILLGGQISVSIDASALIESLGRTALRQDTSGLLEISGQVLTLPDAVALFESGFTIRNDAPATAEHVGLVGHDPTTTTLALIDGGYLVLDKNSTSLSIGRVRTAIAPYTTLGTTVQPFDPFSPGLMDIFGCDFTADVGAATIASTTWAASFDSGNTAAFDDTPQARVITAWAPTSVYVVNPLDNTLEKNVGSFSVAAIGAIPVSAVGGVYNLTITAHLSDTRIIEVTSSFLCTAR
jgi:hypothetical protein